MLSEYFQQRQYTIAVESSTEIQTTALEPMANSVSVVPQPKESTYSSKRVSENPSKESMSIIYHFVILIDSEK